MTYAMRQRHHPGRSPVAFFAVIGLVVAVTGGWAQEPVRLKAEAVPPTVVLGDTFRYRLTIETAPGVQASQPAMPDFAPFLALRTSNSKSYSFLGNEQSISFNFDVVLQASKVGEFMIPPAKVEADGKSYESNPVKVAVVRDVEETIAKAGADGLEGFISARTGDPNIDKRFRGRLFLYTEVDKTDVVPYEPVIARTYVYKAPGLMEGESYFYSEEPPSSAADYLQIEIHRGGTIHWESVPVGNTTFQRALVEEVALVPTKTGDFDYRASRLVARLTMRVSSRRDSPFDDPLGDPFASFFGPRRPTAELPPATRHIQVHPLPFPQPKDFSGIVGDFHVTAAVDRPEAKEGEIVTYKLEFNGSGYADAIPEQSLPALDGFSLFDKKVEASTLPSENGIEGTKTFEFLLRATKPGLQIIPERSFVLFNPVENRYVTRSSEAVNVLVKQGDQTLPIAIAQGLAEPGSRAGIRRIALDIAHIHTGEWDPKPGVVVPLYAKPGWWILQMAPPLILLSALFFRKRRRFLEKHPELVRRGRAGGEAERRLRKARKYLASQQSDLFYAEVASAIRGFLGDQLGREPSGLTQDEIARLLTERGVDDEVRSHTERILEACDTARYALGADATASRESMYDEAAGLLRRLREALS